MASQQTCNRTLLSQSLDERLPEQQEESLAEHLSACVACQQELEQLAAGQHDWTRISQALKHEAESGRSSSLVDASFSPEDAGGADFAVDFLEPSPSREAIGRLGDIDILAEIGRGGMGIVLKGFQPELKRLVAVKVLAPFLAASGPARRRFAREAQAAAAILHPNVMPILAVHSGGKLPFLVMPYLACESLEQRIARQGPLEVVDVLRIGMQIAAGLAAAHAQGLVHRDVKPANILLEKGVDRVLLTDFGLARAVDDASLTRTGLIAGTPQFMSPEQARGEAVDARSDQFSLGSVLYTMAAGRPPFRAESTYGILRRIVESEPRPLRELDPRVPAWLGKIIAQLHSKSPEQRFASAETIAELLKQCLAHVQQPGTTPLPEFCKISPEHRTKRWLLLAGGAFLLAAIAGGVMLGPWFQPAAPNSEPIEKAKPESSSSSPNSDGAATDWNAIDRELESLLRDGEKFEEQAGRLWPD